jgi:hypothetical protein
MEREVLGDAAKLYVLAEWLDKYDDERGFDGKREVQADLRRIALAYTDALGERDRARAALEQVEKYIPGKGLTVYEIARAALATHPKATDEGTPTSTDVCPECLHRGPNYLGCTHPWHGPATDKGTPCGVFADINADGVFGAGGVCVIVPKGHAEPHLFRMDEAPRATDEGTPGGG